MPQWHRSGNNHSVFRLHSQGQQQHFGHTVSWPRRTFEIEFSAILSGFVLFSVSRTGRCRVDTESCFPLRSGCVLWTLMSGLNVCTVSQRQVCSVFLFCRDFSAVWESGPLRLHHIRTDSGKALFFSRAFCCFADFFPENNLEYSRVM